jgi:hypothetical protein
MDLQEFSYELPEALIAAFPSGKREDSRLLVVRRSTGELNHTLFSELGNFLDPGDLIVLNDTKVFPARLHGVKESGGKVEVLLLERFPDQRSLWMALVDAAKKPKVGSRPCRPMCGVIALPLRPIGNAIKQFMPAIRGLSRRRRRDFTLLQSCLRACRRKESSALS